MPSPSIVDTPEEAAALDRPPLLVRRPLEAALDAAGLGSGPVEADPIGDGHSNVTYLLRREGADVVLRRPPRPPLPPSAHDVVREARLLRALADTPVLVPEVLLINEDEATIGGPFYVMERVEGDVISDELPARFDDEASRRAIVDALVDALVDVHAVDWRAAGLEWFGRDDLRYLERQLRRFGGLWEQNATREIAAVTETAEWLAAHRPEQHEVTVVHGDFRLGNVMLAPDGPTVAAIFDWELSTLGDPLADLGYLLATYTEPGEGTREDPFGSLGSVTDRPGFPTRSDIAERYAAASGRTVGDVRWYTVLALWKSVVFLEGSYKRHKAGSTDDPFFAMLEHGIPNLAERALGIAKGDITL